MYLHCAMCMCCMYIPLQGDGYVHLDLGKTLCQRKKSFLLLKISAKASLYELWFLRYDILAICECFWLILGTIVVIFPNLVGKKHVRYSYYMEHLYKSSYCVITVLKTVPLGSVVLEI